MRLVLAPHLTVLALVSGCATTAPPVADTMRPLAQLGTPPGETATLRGRVLGTDDAPIERATVIVWTPSVPESVFTDAQGQFSVAGLAAGQHRVSVYVGETCVDTEVKLEAGRVETLVLPRVAAATARPEAPLPPSIRGTTEQGRSFGQDWLRHVPHRERTSTGALDDVSGTPGNGH